MLRMLRAAISVFWRESIAPMLEVWIIILAIVALVVVAQIATQDMTWFIVAGAALAFMGWVIVSSRSTRASYLEQIEHEQEEE